MKVVNIRSIKSPNSVVTVADCVVDKGFCKTSHGSLPDIDSDFNATRREEVKAYLERRYNKDGMQRVFSAGTFTTEKIKSSIKDVARTYKISQGTVNYLTAILDDDKMTWTNLMRLAVTDKRIRDFIQKYPDVFEEILPIMGQARSAGIHASAVIIVPEEVKGQKIECFDLLPIRKMGDLLVSEISGNDIDAIGILKNDVLGIKELSRMSDILSLIENEYDIRYTILEIASKYLNDPKVFEILRAGNTQGIFQMSGIGITRFIKRLAPDNINDLIASVAIYRPGPLETGAADNYVRAKRGEYDPEYIWGTYDILKDTFGELIYQESVSFVVQKIGGLGLGDGVNLVKAISKKKLDKIRKFKDKFFDGAKKNGCPKDAADKIWFNVESAASYLFNKSHATAYGLTAYVGAWLKAHYPTAFYTVVLRDQDESELPVLLREIESAGGTTLRQPDINISDVNFTADFKNNIIYWSLSRIKYLGTKAVMFIIKERQLYGEFADLEDFIKRIFKHKFKSFDDDGTPEIRERCPVTARSVRNLIMAGAFDRCENVGSIAERYGLLSKAAQLLGFTLSEKEVPEDLRDKHYFWSKQQVIICGHGYVDYCRIYQSVPRPVGFVSQEFIDFKILNQRCCQRSKGGICATITSVMAKTYKDKRTGETKHFGKIELQQNTETNILTIWDSWDSVKTDFKNAEGRMIVAVASVKWSDYDEKNVLQIGKNPFIKLI